MYKLFHPSGIQSDRSWFVIGCFLFASHVHKELKTVETQQEEESKRLTRIVNFLVNFYAFLLT